MGGFYAVKGIGVGRFPGEEGWMHARHDSLRFRPISYIQTAGEGDYCGPWPARFWI